VSKEGRWDTKLISFSVNWISIGDQIGTRLDFTKEHISTTAVNPREQDFTGGGGRGGGVVSEVMSTEERRTLRS